MSGWLAWLVACAPIHEPVDTAREARPPSATIDSAADSTPTATGATPGHTADTASTTPPLPTVPAEFRSSPRPCADPVLRAALGPLEVISLGERPVSTRHVWGGGLVGGDLDGDGAFELLLPTETGVDWLEWDGTQLASVSAAPDVDLSMGVGGTPADIDGDGDLDLVLTRWGARNRLLRNDAGVFVDATEGSGLRDESLWSMSAGFGDLDGDGDLDLAIGNYGETPWFDVDNGQPSRLYLNDGDGTFTDASDRIAPWGDGWTFNLTWQDVDGDRWPELLVLNDNANASESRVLHNERGVLVDAPNLGFFPDYDSMGQGVGDLNGDGVPDFVHTTFAWLQLRESLPADTVVGTQWIDVGPARGLEHDSNRGQYFGWGTDLVDLDHDGDLDVPMVYGFWDTYPVGAQGLPEEDWYHDALFLDDGGTYRDAAAEWGFDSPAAGRGLLVADVDDDGWLDLVKRQLDGPDLLYRARCGDAAWLAVRLHAPPPNTHAVGAEVRVDAGGVRRTRWVGAGSTSLFTGGPPEAWFGLGDTDTATLTVVWPDSTTSTAELTTRAVVDVFR
ncbi:MAG: hypothetical protein ACI8PZ_002976 [Myxococcota bacterium]|jgi:hypothetical protein